ncbi:MAG: hypothetical protein R3324_15765, partial [Halobacteriales archaeon]|nr:hypothetical protein [Halobacteriales archaeon]
VRRRSTLVGWVTLEFTSEDLHSSVCSDYREALITLTYMVDGEATVTDSNEGWVLNYADFCRPRKSGYFRFQFPHGEGRTEFFVYSDDDEMPSGPPDLSTYSKSWFSQWVTTNGEFSGWFQTRVTDVYAGPESMRDCKDGGWRDFGFADPLQCIAVFKKSGASR